MTQSWTVWVGAYADRQETGITRLTMDGDTGRLTKEAEYGGIENPSFLALNRAGTVLYAVSETMTTGDGEEGGLVVAYPLEPGTGRLLPGWERRTHGGVPCHARLDADERWLAVANYMGSSVTMYPLEPGGKPGAPMVRLRHVGSGPNAERQEAPHPHASLFSPDGTYLFVPDLGIDTLMGYRHGPAVGEWSGHEAIRFAPGDGPRHLAFHPEGHTAYVIHELSNRLSRLSYDAPSGRLELRETLPTVPETFAGASYCAEVAVSPDGRFVYGSNRGHESIAIFGTDGPDGALRPAGHVSTRGNWPRHFAISPDGRWLIAANEHSGNLVVFRIDAESGLPIYAGVDVPVSRPSCVLIRPA